MCDYYLRRRLIPTALLVMVMVTACGPAPAPTPTAAPTATDSPTATATATFTPEPTATATPTEVPTPTEIPGAKLSMDWENPPRIPWEDAYTGNLRSAVDKPFAADAGFQSDLGVDYFSSFNASKLYPRHSLSFNGGDVEKRPIRPSGFGLTTTPGGTEVLIIREDVLNADGTIDHWNLMIDRSSPVVQRSDYAQAWAVEGGSHFLMPLVGGGNPKHPSKLGTKEMFDLANASCPNALEYYQEFAETKNVPPGMSDCLLVGYSESWE